MISAIALNFSVPTSQHLWYFSIREFSKSPASLLYHEGATPFGYTGLALELQPPGPINPTWPQYRTSVGQVDFNVLFSWNPVGMFDIERLPQPANVNRVPLETYFPPVATLLYDEQGHPVNPPRIASHSQFCRIYSNSPHDADHSGSGTCPPRGRCHQCHPGAPGTRWMSTQTARNLTLMQPTTQRSKQSPFKSSAKPGWMLT